MTKSVNRLHILNNEAWCNIRCPLHQALLLLKALEQPNASESLSTNEATDLRFTMRIVALSESYRAGTVESTNFQCWAPDPSLVRFCRSQFFLSLKRTFRSFIFLWKPRWKDSFSERSCFCCRAISLMDNKWNEMKWNEHF